ncbi:MAG: amino acid-binding protein [Actinocatenispora sp.]
MLTRLRVRLPDRPGTLGRAAAALGTVGIDIHQIKALERAGGRAIIDLVVALPAAMLPGAVARYLAEIPGVRVEGCWQTGESLDLDTDLEVIAEAVANPVRALTTVIDAAPRFLHAHWAVAFEVGTGRLAHASWRAPKITPPDLRSVRPRSLTAADGTRIAVAPIGADHVALVGRRNAPPFHPAELHRLTRLADTAAGILAVHDSDTPLRHDLALVSDKRRG